MNQRTAILWAAAMGCLAVLIGAFGAHLLKPILTANGRLENYEVAVKYHFYHTLAMLLTASLMNQFPSKKLQYAALLFLTGIFFFSGSLYILSFTGERLLGAITPIGGLLFITGWLMLFAGVIKKIRP